jgi:transposase-like protein
LLTKTLTASERGYVTIVLYNIPFLSALVKKVPKARQQKALRLVKHTHTIRQKGITVNKGSVKVLRHIKHFIETVNLCRKIIQTPAKLENDA